MSEHQHHSITTSVIRNFRPLRHHLIEELTHIRNYHVHSERKLVDAHLELVESRPLTPRLDEPDAIWNDFEHEMILYGTAMNFGQASVRLLRAGILFSTIAFLEDWLMKVCAFCTEFTPRRSIPRNLHQKGLRKMIQFLEEVCEVDISMADPRFEEIWAFGQIKNIFSHTQGFVAKRSQLSVEVMKITSNPALCVWAGNQLVLRHGFCEQLLVSTENCGERTSDAIGLWVQKTLRQKGPVM